MKCNTCGKTIRKGEKYITSHNPLNLLISVAELRHPDKYQHDACWLKTAKPKKEHVVKEGTSK